MFDRNFNNNLQNTVTDQSSYIDPTNNMYFGENEKVPYRQGMSMSMPQPMAGNVTSDSLYPLESSLATPYLNPGANRSSYARGGRIKKEKEKPYHIIAEMVRRKGKGEDSILAHINPLEAMILENIGGSGTINPETGLPQFSFWTKPGKATRSWIADYGLPIGGSILGNMVMPGIGGTIGGSLGGAVGAKLRGRKVGQGALKGGLIGAMLPSGASLAGSGANALGMNNVGSALSNYGTQNSLLASLGMGGGNSGPIEKIISSGKSSPMEYVTQNIGSNAAKSEVEKGFLEKLTGNTSNFLSKPANIMALASAAGSMLNRPKEKTPERLAAEQKRFQLASLLTPEEMAKKEAAMLAEEQAKRRVSRNKFLPEERFTIDPLYRKTLSPKEMKKNGKWLEYYDNPNFNGNPINFNKGGSVIPHMIYKEEQRVYPLEESYLIEGEDGGQDDNIHMRLPENSYIVDASTVSNLGDGNSKAGAKKLEALVSSGEFFIPPHKVTRLGKGSNQLGAKMLDNMVKNIRKHKGGSIKLPPKAKPLNSYIRG